MRVKLKCGSTFCSTRAIDLLGLPARMSLSCLTTEITSSVTVLTRTSGAMSSADAAGTRSAPSAPMREPRNRFISLGSRGSPCRSHGVCVVGECIRGVSGNPRLDEAYRRSCLAGLRRRERVFARRNVSRRRPDVYWRIVRRRGGLVVARRERRRVAVVDEIPAPLEVRVADESVSVERGLLEQVGRVEQVRARL